MQAFRRAEVTTMIPLMIRMKSNAGSVVAAESVIGVTGLVI